MSRVVGFVPAPSPDWAQRATHLVVGNAGEVGGAVMSVLLNITRGWDDARVTGYDIADDDSVDIHELAPVDVLHICVPPGPEASPYARVVDSYRDVVNPLVTIVYSTTPVGWCDRLGVVHSPIEGQHRGGASGLGSIRNALRSHPRILGSRDGAQLALAAAVWRLNECEPLVVPSAAVTEFLKLRSTFLYGVDIMLAQWTADALDELDCPEDAARTYDEWWADIYSSDAHLARSFLTAPHGPIGGHCVVPNAALLQMSHPHPFAEFLARWNDAYIGS